MAIISLGLSILDLPKDMRPFFILFSRMTILAVMSVDFPPLPFSDLIRRLISDSCLVSYTAVIWYGYNEALAALPVEKTEAEIKLAKLLKRRPDRPDEWVTCLLLYQTWKS